MKKYLKTGIFILTIVLIFVLSTSIISAQDTVDLNTTSDSNTNNMDSVDLDITSNSDTTNNVNSVDLNISNDFNENAQTSYNTYTFSDLQNQIDKSEDNSSITINGTYKYNKDIDESNSLIDGVVISKNLTIIGNNCTIDGSYLARCLHLSSNLNIVLENLTIINGYSQRDNGGGLRADEYVNLTLKNCVFENNTVYNWNGGAFSTDKGCNIEVYNSSFENNTSIRVSSLKWHEFKRGMGSAIRSFINSTLKLYNSYFGFNNAYLSTILLVTYDDENPPEISTLFIDNCIFNNNTSRSCGVIYLDEYGQGEVLNSIFTNNTSRSSGTLILDTCPYSLVKNCTFINNFGVRGAAICIRIFTENSTSNAQIVDCKFINNTASTYGGAIYSVGGITSVKNCYFENNDGNKRGGGIYSRLGNLKVSNCEFKNNLAIRGGAIYVASADSSIISSKILKNYAADKGGSIFSTLDYSLLNCSIAKNKAVNDKNKFGVYNNFKATVKIAAAKVKTSYKSGKTMKIALKYTKNKYITMNVKLKIKVYTGKKYKTYYATTNRNGIAYFKASGFSKGTHKVEITSANSYVKFKKVKTSIAISKSKGKIYAPKITSKYKSKSYFNITLKHKSTKKVLSGIKIKIKIYSGNKFKTYVKKTSSKGKIRINTKSLKKGKHNVEIISLNSNINFYKKSRITIK